MPELPDIEAYLVAIRRSAGGQALTDVRFNSPFLLRTVTPRPAELTGRPLAGLSRIGKRIVLEFEGGPCAVLHLMISGRLHWRGLGAKIGGRTNLAAFDFETGSLVLTEASTQKRAALHLFESPQAARALDPGGLELLTATHEEFHTALVAANHTIKRSLTDPHIISGIGNAYSDEILHAAHLSPFRLTRDLSPGDTEALFGTARALLSLWRDRLCAEAEGTFPEGVTAFRPDFAVHGRFGLPCPVCRTPVQRIVYANNEANYCPTCQTGGRLLADRALSRFLKSDWPRTLEELEEMKAAQSR